MLFSIDSQIAFYHLFIDKSFLLFIWKIEKFNHFFQSCNFVSCLSKLWLCHKKFRSWHTQTIAIIVMLLFIYLFCFLIFIYQGVLQCQKRNDCFSESVLPSIEVNGCRIFGPFSRKDNLCKHNRESFVFPLDGPKDS